MLNQQLFTECLESDIGLSNHLKKYFLNELDVDCDLLLFSEHDITVFDPQQDQLIQVSKAAIEDSLTHQAV